jgi:N-carbamoylputrescine amidase
LAEPVAGPISRKLSDLAAGESICILAGLVEKDAENRIYASHLVVKPDGGIDRYRKVHIAPPEKGVFHPAASIPIFELAGVTFGIQLCYDAHFPELTIQMALRGADIIFMPHASPRGTPEEKYASWLRHLPARAYDNSVFIVACNQTGDNGMGLQFPGLAMVIDPSGSVLMKNISGDETILITDLSHTMLDNIRSHRMRYFLPNRRPELYDMDRQKK